MMSHARGMAIVLLLSGCSLLAPGASSDGKGDPAISAVENTASEPAAVHLSLRSCSPLPGQNAPPSCEQLTEANAAYERGDIDVALDGWRTIIASDDDGPAWYAAVTNCGGALAACQRHADAIPLLMLLIENDAAYQQTRAKGPIGGFGGRVAASSSLDGYIDRHTNDWHHACQKLSECHEALGNLDEAHRFAILSRDSYRYSDWCGNAAMSVQMAASDRVVRLEQAINDRRAHR